MANTVFEDNTAPTITGSETTLFMTENLEDLSILRMALNNRNSDIIILSFKH